MLGPLVNSLVASLLALQSPQPGVVIEPAQIDFGRLAAGESRTGKFVVRNDGPAPVRIASAFPSCKCTAVTDVAGRELVAGGSLEISATLEAPRAPGPKDAKIFVVLEGASQPMVARMEGVVTWPVQPEPPYVDALQGRTTGTVRLASTDGRPFRVLGVDGHPAGDRDRPAAAQQQVAWDVRTPPEGGLRQWMLVETDHPEAPLIPLRIRHESTGVRFDPGAGERGWFLPENVVLCGKPRPGETLQRTLVLENGTPRGKPRPKGWDQVQEVRSLDPRVKVEVAAAQPRGDSVLLTLRVVFEPGASGFVHLPVAIRTASGEGRCFVAAVVQP